MYLYWEKANQVAVRMRNWKAVGGPKGKLDLYDLTDDIGEKADVAAAHPEIVARIKSIIAEAHTSCPSTDWQDPRR